MAITKGTHHIGLTVSNLTETTNFFVNILGFEQIAEKPDYPAIFISDGTIILTLWQASDPANAVPFDRKNNVGLHHFALKLDNLETLNSTYQTLLNTPEVEIELDPEPTGGGAARHFIFYIPGGIRMELVAPVS